MFKLRLVLRNNGKLKVFNKLICSIEWPVFYDWNAEITDAFRETCFSVEAHIYCMK